VIDPVRKVLFAVVWRNPHDSVVTYELHALNLTDGSPATPAKLIQGSAAGPHGTVAFDPVWQKQRPALLLVRPEDVPPARRGDLGPDGTLYIAFGASAEGFPLNGRPSFNGWVFACDARTLQVRGQPWCSTPKEG